MLCVQQSIQISPRSCQNHLTESSGTIRSPNYPSFYPASSDCRWNIQVESGFHIRLFFGIFEMQSGHDTLYVRFNMATDCAQLVNRDVFIFRFMMGHLQIPR